MILFALKYNAVEVLLDCTHVMTTKEVMAPVSLWFAIVSIDLF